MTLVVAPRRVPMLRHSLVAIADERKWAGIRGGVGSSKTTTWCWWLLRRLKRYPIDHNAIVVGADYQQLARGMFATLVAVLDDAKIKYTYRERPTPMIRFGDGTRLRSMSAKTSQRIRSLEIDTLLCEEPQTWERGSEVFDVLIGRLRGSRAAQARYGDTLQPQGRLSFNPPIVSHWLHELIEEQWPAQGYICYQFTVRHNVLMPRLEEYIAALQARLPPSRWPSEIDGHWATASGGVIREFDRTVHGNPPAAIPRGLDRTKPLLWSLDFNVGHQRSVIAQGFTQRLIYDGVEIQPGRPPEHRYHRDIERWQRRILRFVGEIALDDTGVRQVVAAFIDRYGDVTRKNGVVLYGDASGGARSQIDGIASNWSTVMEELTRAGIKYDYRVPKANGAVLNRIQDADAQFRTGDGCGATVDLDECVELLADLEGAKWAPNGHDIDKKSDPRRSHAVDAASYLCVGFRKAAALLELREHEQRTGRDGQGFFAR